MNVIITNTFKKDFCKIFPENMLSDFSEKLKNVNAIHLKIPYKKYKITLKNTAIRGVYILSIKNYKIPIFIVKKSDKKYGNNLIITKEIALILKGKYKKNINDIENNIYQIF